MRADGDVEVLRFIVGGEATGYIYNLVRDGTVSYYASGFRYENETTG